MSTPPASPSFLTLDQGVVELNIRVTGVRMREGARLGYCSTNTLARRPDPSRRRKRWGHGASLLAVLAW
jgi:hypothetical protein